MLDHLELAKMEDDGGISDLWIRGVPFLCTIKNITPFQCFKFPISPSRHTAKENSREFSELFRVLRDAMCLNILR